jgi:23S rRNA (uracil1939-C5)-methyltransferase
MYKGRIFDGLIESVTEDGSGVAKDDGYTVFVKGGVIGDSCKIEITKANKSYGFGRIVELSTPSPHRIQPPCGFFPACGGCTLLHTDYEKALEIKADTVRNALSRIGGFQDVIVHPCVASSPCFHYRNKSQYPVGGKIGDVKIGFYAPKSHTVVDSDSCLIENETTRLVVSEVRNWMNAFSIPPYNEEDGSGLVRHIYVRCGDDVMLTLVCTKRNVPYTDELLKSLMNLPVKLSGVVININPKKTNTILGDKDKLIFGNPYITSSIGSLSYKVSYRSFFQVNSFTTPLLYEKALELCNLSGDETVFDLYCGIGTISLFLARKAKKVIGIEIVPDAVRDAKENAALNNIENALFYTGSAEDVCPRLIKNGDKADVVVVDPPRKGCDERLLDSIGKMSPEKIVYVSCNVSTLARDAKFLAEKYGYTLSEAFPFDQFPHSMHVETVALMSRV